jgi:hypothetical protein
MITVCEAVGVGVYPTVTIADIRGQDQSARNLWKQFNILQLNEELMLDLNSTEVPICPQTLLNYY